MDRDTSPGDPGNIVLIGMPGSGKSTAGVLLAKYTAREFVDTDLVIQSALAQTLDDLVRAHGYLGFRRLEERTVCRLDCRRSVIATGGSVPYSQPAMTHLRSAGVVVFLDVPMAELALRIGDMDRRGVSRRPGQTLGDLYCERLPLYRRFAQVTVDCGRMSQEAVARGVMGRVCDL